MNARRNTPGKRFNGTVQEEFVGYIGGSAPILALEDRLSGDLYGFNDALFTYMERYNAERPHQNLGSMTPCQGIEKQLPHLSRM